MKKIALIFGMLPLAAFAETGTLEDALNVARSQCSGISARMEGIKKMAGIGTAVNAVGTATGIGGVASGIVKYKTDQKTIGLKKDKAEIDAIIEVLEAAQDDPENAMRLLARKKLYPQYKSVIAAVADGSVVVGPNGEQWSFYAGINKEKAEGLVTQETIDKFKDGNKNVIGEFKTQSDKLQKEIDEKQQKSTAAGNARTALFAVDTATNVAGAVVSSKTVADEDLMGQIQKCKESIELLKTARLRAQMEDSADAKTMEISQNVLNKCGEYQYLDLSKINNLAKGAMVTNSVGAVSGTVATITSALGNKKKISEMEVGSEEIDKNMKMNTASNVLGGVTTAASLTGTALNATQIVEAKKILNVSQECEETLKW